MDKSKTYFIGCGVLGPDVKHIARVHGIVLKSVLLPGGLHNNPGQLRTKLQEAIDTASEDVGCKRIIVGYGMCGRGTVGIRARSVPLVFPKVHDCIALFLGSDQAYREQFAKFPGTFYISAGWYREKEGPKIEKHDDEHIWVGSGSMGCRELREKYGAKQSREIIDFFSSWKANYQRVAFIDTGTSKSTKYERYAKEIAEQNGWQYERIKGRLDLISRLLMATSSDNQLLIVPPGQVTVYSPIYNCLDSAPVVKNVSGAVSGREPRYLYFGGNKKDKQAIGRISGTPRKNPPRHRFGLGIDAGGTYTDAVIYNFVDKTVVSKKKALTTKWDFTIGIGEALADFHQQTLAKVDLVSVSTTLATNAIVEGEGQRAGMLIMPGPGAACDELSSYGPWAEIKGQLSISGQEVQSIDKNQVHEVARKMIEKESVTAFAVSGFGGSVNPAHELEVKNILVESFGMIVCCGHELSDQLNLVVRAQTALLNARIIPRMVKFFQELQSIFVSRAIHAPIMVVKGDGTLVSVRMAVERPVETVLSGPAASVAGAKLLTGLEQALVVDIGGTTTDTGTLENGLVKICTQGARVGNTSTHVKALDIRTVGLGGDSLIRYATKSELHLGPRRVAPVSWASTRDPGGMDRALQYMEKHAETESQINFSQVILMSSERDAPEHPLFPFQPTKQELDLLELLYKRPHCLEELARILGLNSHRFLNSRRLEEVGLVQRCGLTPTDILHLEGSFVQWHKEAAERMVSILAHFSQKEPAALIRLVRHRFEKTLARELVLKHLAEDVEVQEETDSRLLEHLLQCMLGKKGRTYQVRAKFDHPIVGIGAPAPHFLPATGRLFDTEVLIPKDGDVANALGAISSNIVIRETLEIRPAAAGGFQLQGIAGPNHFNDIDEVEKLAVEHLLHNISSKGRKAGTRSDDVTMEIKDTIVDTADGASLFLGRTISATLVGLPEL